MSRLAHTVFTTWIAVSLGALVLGCGGTGNPGAIYDPTPPGSGGGGGGGGGGVANGPSAAPTPGSISLAGAPTVLDVAPSSQAASTETPVAVTFSESVQASTVSATSLTLRVQGGSTLASTISNFGGGRFFVLVPTTSLPANRTIEVVATNSILDLDGAHLVVPTGGVIGSFKTELTPTTVTSPSVIAAFPPNGAKNVAPGSANYVAGSITIPGTPTQVIYVFSEPMAPSAILGNPTPPITPDKIGLTLTQLVDPDGTGPQQAVPTVLIPGTGALLLPFSDNRVWVATPTQPFAPGSTVQLAVGPGATNDDLTPKGVTPPFSSSFSVAAFSPPTFVNIDVTPATTEELAATPTVLNNVEKLPDGDSDPNNNPLNPTFAGNFTVGVVFPATSLASDVLDIQMHDATSGGVVTFTRKARGGAGQLDYGDNVNGARLSLLGKTGNSLLTQGSITIAARVRRGTTTSAWTVGPPALLDTIAPAIGTIGPPAEGATLFTPSRASAVYGTVSEAPASILYTSIESPVGTPVTIPTPASLQGHLLRASGNTFSLMPLIPPPSITAGASGTPPEEPVAGATILVTDAVGNTSPDGDPSPTAAGTPIKMVHRGRIGGPSIATQNAMTVVVYDRDTLAIVPTAVVLLDVAAPSGNSTSQVKRNVTSGTGGGVVAARFAAPADFAASTPALTVTASAPNYDITTFVGVQSSFISIPIRRTNSGATTADPSLQLSLGTASPGTAFDAYVNERPELSDALSISSQAAVGGIPIFGPVSVAAQRPLFLSSFMKASSSFTFTYLNDAFTFPTLPLALGGSSSATFNFGQSFSQTTDTSDDPISVPASGGIPVTLPGAPFDSNALSGNIEVGLFAPGTLVGVPGQMALGQGRADSVSGSLASVSVSFDPKSNAFFFAPIGPVLVPFSLDPNAFPTVTRVGVRAQDTSGNVSRAFVRSVTTGGPISGVTLPDIPSTVAQTSATGAILSPKVRWTDTVPTSDGIYQLNLRFKQTSPIREWRVYVPHGAADLSINGQAAVQLPSLVAYGTDVGTSIPVPGSKLDQIVEAISMPGLNLADFFFEDLRTGSLSPLDEGAVTIARGVSIEITY